LCGQRRKGEGWLAERQIPLKSVSIANRNSIGTEERGRQPNNVQRQFYFPAKVLPAKDLSETKQGIWETNGQRRKRWWLRKNWAKRGKSAQKWTSRNRHPADYTNPKKGKEGEKRGETDREITQPPAGRTRLAFPNNEGTKSRKGKKARKEIKRKNGSGPAGRVHLRQKAGAKGGHHQVPFAGGEGDKGAGRENKT